MLLLLGDADMESIKQKLKAPNLPEQLFGDSILRLSHEDTGVSLSFTAQDALQAWVAEDRQPVRVDAAEEWMKSRERDVQLSGAISLDYDWWALRHIKRHILSLAGLCMPSIAG